jgi:hypothetical protein
LHIFYFGSSRRQIDPNLFATSFFSGNRRTRKEEVNGERHEEKDKAHHVGQELATWWGHFFFALASKCRSGDWGEEAGQDKLIVGKIDSGGIIASTFSGWASMRDRETSEE